MEFIRKDVKIGSNVEDAKHWQLIFDEYIKQFGLNEEFELYMKTRIDKAVIECEYVESGNRKHLNKINQLNAKLELMMKNNGVGLTTGELLQILSKFQGYRIDIKTITVAEYFDLINVYKKFNKDA